MCPFSPKRRGLSLVELLTATAILVLVAGAIASLAATVQTTNRHGQGRATATQHAKVALERIERTLREAHASAEFPGFVVVAEQIGSWSYPDCLVVWRPKGSLVADPAGRPLFAELVIFRPNPDAPHELLEITVLGDGRITPPVENAIAWRSELDGLAHQASYEAVTLTNLLHTANAGGGSVFTSALRGAVRFETEQTPSDADLADFRAGQVAWKDLPWVQGIRGDAVGLRQTRCRIELQLRPEARSPATEIDGAAAIPFFGSATLHYEARP